MLKRPFLILTIAILSLTAGAQDSISTLSCSWVPQYLAEHGMRVDLDLRLKKAASWIVIAPQVYLDHRYAGPHVDDFGFFLKKNDEYYYEEMYGFGLEVHHRIYMQNRAIPEGLYFSYSLYYMHFNIKYLEYGWETTDYDEDLDVLTYGLHNFDAAIDKFGPNIMFGYQMNLTDNFFIDLYMGAGLRYSIIDISEYSLRNFDDHMTSFGYTGPLPVFALRLGMLF